MLTATLHWPSLFIATFVTTLFSIALWHGYGVWRVRRIRRRWRQLQERSAPDGKNVEWIIIVSGIDDIVRR